MPFHERSTTPHLSMAHSHLNWLMDQVVIETGDPEDPIRFSFTSDHVSDLLFILVNLLMSYIEDETEERARSRRTALARAFAGPDVQTMGLITSKLDPGSPAVTKLLDALRDIAAEGADEVAVSVPPPERPAKSETDVDDGVSDVEPAPVYPEGQRI